MILLKGQIETGLIQDHNVTGQNEISYEALSCHAPLLTG